MKRIPHSRHAAVLKTLRHEFGHYVAARVAGFRTGAIAVQILEEAQAHPAGSDLKLWRPLRGIDDILRYLEDRIVVLYAGAMAEALANSKVDTDMAMDCLLTKGGQGDRSKAVELLQLARSIGSPDQNSEADMEREMSGLETAMLNRSRELIEAESSLIENVAHHFSNRVQFFGQRYVFSADELNEVDVIRTRFAAP